MANLGAIKDDVQFNWHTAASLIAELRATAATLEGQVGPRGNQASLARRVWQGVYAEQFDGRVSICTGDATRLARSMRRAATDLESLARLAREEQQRREYAREWVANNDDGGLLDSIGDALLGEDDLPPPRPPIEPPPIPTYDASPSARGAAAPSTR